MKNQALVTLAMDVLVNVVLNSLVTTCPRVKSPLPSINLICSNVHTNVAFSLDLQTPNNKKT